jgi:cell division septal protein FtsQ
LKIPEEKKLNRIAFWVLTLILGLTFFIAWGLNYLKFDYDFEKFLPEQVPQILK